MGTISKKSSALIVSSPVQVAVKKIYGLGPRTVATTGIRPGRSTAGVTVNELTAVGGDQKREAGLVAAPCVAEMLDLIRESRLLQSRQDGCAERLGRPNLVIRT